MTPDQLSQIAARCDANADMDKRRERYILGGPMALFLICREQKKDLAALLSHITTLTERVEEGRKHVLALLGQVCFHFDGLGRAEERKAALAWASLSNSAEEKRENG